MPSFEHLLTEELIRLDDEPFPESAVVVAAVYRRRRRRTFVVATAGIASVLAIGLAATGLPYLRTLTAPPLPASSARPVHTITPPSGVYWFGLGSETVDSYVPGAMFADGSGYLVDEHCPKGRYVCTQRLAVTEDAGRTWHLRDLPAQQVSLQPYPMIMVVGPHALLYDRVGSGTTAHQRFLSTDLGATWQVTREVTVQEVSTVAAGALPAGPPQPILGMRDYEVLTPDRGLAVFTSRPPAPQNTIAQSTDESLPVFLPDGTIMVIMTESTTPNGSSADGTFTAVPWFSRDGGATWSAASPPFTHHQADSSYGAFFSTVDGRRLFAIDAVNTVPVHQIFRSDDAGASWGEVAFPTVPPTVEPFVLMRQLAGYNIGIADSYFSYAPLADGTLLATVNGHLFRLGPNAHAFTEVSSRYSGYVTALGGGYVLGVGIATEGPNVFAITKDGQTWTEINLS